MLMSSFWRGCHHSGMHRGPSAWYGQDPVVLQTSWLAHDITAPPPCALLYANGSHRASITADNMQHLGGLVDAGQSADCGQTGECLLLTL